MMKTVREKLIQWFDTFQRDLPWRHTHDPYMIWLSEIILQQTRIDQGLPYYHRFIERFPDVYELAHASEDEVLNLWQGLGYYNRARNLHHTAQVIARNYSGEFPGTYEELKKLKGIGDYTAAAISSMAFDQPQAVVDGNVYRVLSRLFGIKKPVNSTAGKKAFKEKAEKLLDRHQPGKFNEALMDFGAIQCKSASPKCGICPLQSQCYAFHHNEVNTLPVKEKKLKRRTRYFHYVVMATEEGIVLKQRGANDIWQKMFDFPLWENNNNEAVTEKELAEWLNIPEKELVFQARYKHVLTHQDIIAYFYMSNHFLLDKNRENFIFVEWKEVNNYALPRLIQRFYDDYLISIS